MDLSRAFDILGINKKSNKKQIKDAYFKQASQVHPDKRAGEKLEAEEEFKDLSEAYLTAMAGQEIPINSPSHQTSQTSSTRQSPSPQTSRTSHVDRSVFDVLFQRDLFDQFFHDPLSVIQHLFDTRASQHRSSSVTHSSMSCGPHDAFTVCLKCNNNY